VSERRSKPAPCPAPRSPELPPAVAVSVCYGLKRLAARHPAWAAVANAHLPRLITSAAAAAAADSAPPGSGPGAARLALLLSAAPAARGPWRFEGRPPLVPALAAALGAQLLADAAAARGGGGGSSNGGDGALPAELQLGLLALAVQGLLGTNYYSAEAIEGIAQCAALLLERGRWGVVVGGGGTGGGGGGAEEEDDEDADAAGGGEPARMVPLRKMAALLYAVAHFDHAAPRLVAAAAAVLAAAAGAPASGSESGGAGAGPTLSGVLVQPWQARNLIQIAWAVAVLEPARLDVAGLVFRLLGGLDPGALLETAWREKRKALRVDERTLRQLMQARARARGRAGAWGGAASSPAAVRQRRGP
jgi:hypothetical protein